MALFAPVRNARLRLAILSETKESTPHMKKLIIFTLALTVSVWAQGKGKGPAGPGMTLTTPAFADGSEIPNKYTQAEQNPPSPKLEWTNVNPSVQSFAIIFHDPDVAIGKQTDDVLHWMIFNIPGSARELPEGVPANATLPDGTVNA